jgi:hypothetical protein
MNGQFPVELSDGQEKTSLHVPDSVDGIQPDNVEVGHSHGFPVIIPSKCQPTGAHTGRNSRAYGVSPRHPEPVGGSILPVRVSDSGSILRHRLDIIILPWGHQSAGLSLLTDAESSGGQHLWC